MTHTEQLGRLNLLLLFLYLEGRDKLPAGYTLYSGLCSCSAVGGLPTGQQAKIWPSCTIYSYFYPAIMATPSPSQSYPPIKREIFPVRQYFYSHTIILLYKYKCSSN